MGTLEHPAEHGDDGFFDSMVAHGLGVASFHLSSGVPSLLVCFGKLVQSSSANVHGLVG